MVGPPERSSHAQLKALFDAVVDLADDHARQAELQRLQAPADLARQVLALVARDRQATALRQPVQAALARWAPVGSELQIGDRIGPWRLTGALGAGGMGQVFAAERDDDLYQQRAAVKVLRGRPDAQLLALLARERQILATLDHPHIARLLDGGSTPAGHPYLVMAYVDGQAIDTWCNRHQADAATRVRLLGQVADALGHAHRHLVVHCDLKPGNVLVTTDGHAVLLDFGIARLLQSGSDASPVALTPGYASPEQVAGAAVTSASDVYSLGRLTQLLLQGQPRPAEWLAIVDRACAVNAEARYGSAAELAADLRRWLLHQPVRALLDRPGQTGYRLRKALRRRWPWVLTAGAVLAGASAFTVGLVHERDRARRAEQQAQQQASTALAVSRFLTGLFQDADPRQARRPDLPAATLLDRGRERMDAELANQPALRSELGLTLGQAYDNLGWPTPAADLYTRSAALAAQAQQPEREADALSRLAVLHSNAGRVAPAEAAAERALQLRQQLHAADSLPVAEALGNLGLVRVAQDRWAEAQGLLARSLEIRRRRLGDDALETATARHNLGFMEQQAGRAEAALAQYVEALRIKQARLGEDHPATLSTMANVTVLMNSLQRNSEAQQMAERLVHLTRQVHGVDSEYHANALQEWAASLHDGGRLAAARQRYEEALRLLQARGSALHQARLHNNLAFVLSDLGLDDQALAHWRTSLQLRRQAAAAPLAIARVEHNLARALLRRDRGDGADRAEAQRLLASAAATRAAQLPDGHADRIASLLLQAEAERRPATLEQAPQRPEQAAHWHRLQARHGAPARALMHWQQAAEALQGLARSHPMRLGAELDWIAALVAAGQADTARERLAALQPQWAGYQGTRAPLLQRAERLQRQLAIHTP